MRRAQFGWCILTVVGIAATATSQEILYDEPGHSWLLAVVGDVDGDGVDDYLRPDGGVELVSGKDGSRIRAHGESGNTVALAGGGDFDGDGVPDYAYATQPRFVVIHLLVSGRTGQTIMEFDGTGSGLMAFPGDLDGDGRSEFAFGRDRIVISSKDQSTLYSFPDLGTALSAAGDVTGDGVGDLFWDDPTNDEIVLVDGSDGSRKTTFIGNSPVGGGDANNDGTPDLLAGSDESLLLYSGADGSELTRWTRGIVPAHRFVGDVNGDGHDDIALGDALDGIGSEPYIGTTRLLSGRTYVELYRFADPEIFSDGYGWDHAALGDIDNDGFGEIVLGVGQRAQVARGAELYLNIWPRHEVEAGDDVAFTTSEGVPGNLALLFVVRVNGTPFNFLLSNGLFDSNGIWVRDLTVPAGLAGLDIGYVTFTLNAADKVIATYEQTLQLR